MRSNAEPSKKRTPRRLLSFDSIKLGDSSKHSRNQTEDTVTEGWLPNTLTQSPKETPVNFERPPPKTPKSKVRKLPSLPLRAGTPEPAPSPSPTVARWETVRKHVLTPTTEARPQSPQPSVISSSSGFVPPRSATPKPSRLARLGFRQVVEQAREAAVDDSRRFTQDIQKACLIAHYGEQSHTTKSRFDREPFGTGVSTLHLPFMINTSYSMPGSASASAVNLSKGRELRRPQSIQSLATSASTRPLPTVKPLNQVLHQASMSPLVTSKPLVLEPMVLSALLAPFLSREASSRVEEERKVAFEAFELVIKSWPPQDQSVALGRCLWCCKAVMHPSITGRHIIPLLRRMIPHEPTYALRTPDAVLAVVEAMFSLLPALQASPFSDPSTGGSGIVKDILGDILQGGLELEPQSLHNEYKEKVTSKDDVTRLLVIGGLARCLERSNASEQRWIMAHLVEEHWPRPSQDASYPPLASVIQAESIRSFSRAALSLLAKKGDSALQISDAHQIVSILRKRISIEVGLLDLPAIHLTKQVVVHVVLEVMMIEEVIDLRQWAVTTISKWYRESSDMARNFEVLLGRIAVEKEWKDILRLLTRLLEVLPHDVCQTLLAAMMPAFCDHLADFTPPSPNLMLSSLLQQISAVFPRIFFKPFFACAAATKEVLVANHLRILTAISKFVTDFWIRDSEMVAVALVGDVGNKAKVDGDDGSPVSGPLKPGQCVILIEVISALQSIRHRKEGSPSADEAIVEAMRFALALEARLAQGLELKEKVFLIHPAQRVLYCILFREIRLLTKSLKPASWLSRTIDWFLTSPAADDEALEQLEKDLQESNEKIRDIYQFAQEGSQAQHNRRSTLLLSPTTKDTFGGDSLNASEGDISALLEKRKTLLDSLSKGFHLRALKLFVVVSSLLSGSDLCRLAHPLWEHHIDSPNMKVTAPACFLIMQCAEKEPLEITATLEVDLRSSNLETKLGAIQKLSIISHWRFQLMSQPINMDRAHRPFKVARGPLPFVATDMGSSQFEILEDPDEIKDNLPLELRKQLAEIGWASEDDDVDQRLQLIKTPLTILPTHHVDRLDVAQDLPPPSPTSPGASPGSSPGRGEKPDEVGLLLRRNSSTGGPLHGVKRKAVFVPAMASLLPRLALVVHDPCLDVSTAARNLLVDFLRNDPALLLRPILDLLSSDHKDVPLALSYLRSLLHIRYILPPPATHHLFNHLAGFLKYISRQLPDAGDGLHDYAYAMPVISELIHQVPSLSVRDVRRAKLELLLVPTGHLWFPSSAPNATTFPLSVRSTRNPFEDSLSGPLNGLIYITMIRVSQNNLYLDILKKNPQDVQHVRKNIARIALPSLDEDPDVPPLELKDFVPRIRSPNRKPSSQDENTIAHLSLVLSKSYLLLFAQVFRCMPRHLNDRTELAVLVDGINRILLTHGDDIGIIAHTLIALMVASTRFRRLFIAGGYTLFMPAIIKVYVESTDTPGIRTAIEYATNRFHALHQEAFVFQSLEAAAHLMKLPDVDSEAFAKGIFDLFSSLRKGFPTAPDAAGIHDANKTQEREALLMKSVEEQPQTLFKFLRSESSKGRSTSMDTSLPEEYESKPMSTDNFVRLILTVIAHDPSNKSKPTETTAEPISDSATVNTLSSQSFFQSELFDKSKQPSDPLSMRQDYLYLIIAYCQAGGDARPSMAFIFASVDQTLKETSNKGIDTQISTFLGDFSRAVLLRTSSPSIKEINGFLEGLMPIIATHTTTIDLSPVLEVIFELMSKETYTGDSSLAQSIFHRVLGPGLAALERAEADKKLASPNFKQRLVFILARCVPFHAIDIFSLIEKRKTPSYEFLAGIVFHFALALGSSSDGLTSKWSETSHQDIYRNVWIRLVAYVMEACRGPQGSKGSESLLSRIRGKTTASETQLNTLAVALQIIKIAVMRAGDDLTVALPSIWTRLAVLLRSLIKDGSARFTLTRGDNSQNASPMHTPRSSGQFDHFMLAMASDNPIPIPSPSLYTRTFQRPRLVDYLTWSLLEFICLYRTPLSLHLGMSLREKMVALEQDLRLQNAGVPPSPSGNRISSMFSKPRRRMSGLPSPTTSPKLGPTSPYPGGVLTPPPSSPSPDLAPHIVHLGPSEANARRPYSSPGEVRDTSAMALKSVRVKSLPLIQVTYKRIRVVQSFMGYSHTLLPMPRSSKWEDDIDNEDEVKVWTKKDALEAIVQEMKYLVDEFEEFGVNLEDEMVVVNSISDQTLTRSTSNNSFT
ncbi:hypothetical protein ONZ45_g7844 [Pleurotus djamor]|nr:hypothetical protein ONZ45_g7844 [Pleurotus djamor]